MADPTPTRQDVVEASIAAVIEKYGNEAHIQIISQCIQDISVSLALLVDAGSGS